MVKPCPIIVHLSAEAKARWIAYYNEHGKKQSDLVGELAAAWAKFREYPARLA